MSTSCQRNEYHKELSLCQLTNWPCEKLLKWHRCLKKFCMILNTTGWFLATLWWQVSLNIHHCAFLWEQTIWSMVSTWFIRYTPEIICNLLGYALRIMHIIFNVYLINNLKPCSVYYLYAGEDWSWDAYGHWVLIYTGTDTTDSEHMHVWGRHSVHMEISCCGTVNGVKRRLRVQPIKTNSSKYRHNENVGMTE